MQYRRVRREIICVQMCHFSRIVCTASTTSEEEGAGGMHRGALRYENNVRPAGHVCKSRQILSLPVSRAYTDISRICAKTTGDAYYIRMPVALISISEKEVSPRYGYGSVRRTDYCHALWPFRTSLLRVNEECSKIKIINDTLVSICFANNFMKFMVKFWFFTLALTYKLITYILYIKYVAYLYTSDEI